MLRRAGIVVLLGLGLATFAGGVITWGFLVMEDFMPVEPALMAAGFLWPAWLFAALCLGGALFLSRYRPNPPGFPVYAHTTAQAGPAHISLICAVETGGSGRSHYCRVHGRETAERLASFLRSEGVPVMVRRAGRAKCIIHFPDTPSPDDASADRWRYENLVLRFSASDRSEASARSP